MGNKIEKAQNYEIFKSTVVAYPWFAELDKKIASLYWFTNFFVWKYCLQSAPVYVHIVPAPRLNDHIVSINFHCMLIKFTYWVLIFILFPDFIIEWMQYDFTLSIFCYCLSMYLLLSIVCHSLSIYECHKWKKSNFFIRRYTK